MPEVAHTYDRLPLVWLGESYTLNGEKMDLHLAREKCSPGFIARGRVMSPAECTFTVAYGDCDPAPSQTGCRIPLQIHVEPLCNEPFGAAAVSPRMPVRGVEAVVDNLGRIFIDTAEMRIQISAPGKTPEEALANGKNVAEDLFGANELARHITKDSDFAPYVEGAETEALCPRPTLPPIIGNPEDYKTSEPTQ